MEDKWTLILLGLLAGIPLGMALYKYLYSTQAVSAPTYGASYSYDAQGRLIQYMPTPLGSTPPHPKAEKQ